MTLQVNLVNLGTYPNDGTGDDLRSAFIKSNNNFQSISDNVVLDVVNLGQGTPLFTDKLGNDLRFKSIKSGNSNMAVSYDSNEITLNVEDSINRLVEDTNPLLGGILNLNGYDIEGFGNIVITGDITADTITGSFTGSFTGNISGDINGTLYGDSFGNLTGNVTGQVSDISNHILSDLADVVSTNPQIGQTLVWNGNSWAPSTSVNKIIAGSNITITPSNGLGEVTIDAELIASESYDFGVLGSARSVAELVLQFTPIDFGSIDNPANVNLDLGSIVGNQPLYNLITSANSVMEGASFVISLTTVNVPNGTTVSYTITGVVSEDIDGAELTGQFTVIDNFASVEFLTTNDGLTETEQLFTITLDEITPIISTSVTIYDIASEWTTGDIDGGLASTTSFNFVADGGLASTTSFNFVADGGTIATPISLLDGGTPSDSFTEFADGGTPLSSATEIYDGGSAV